MGDKQVQKRRLILEVELPEMYVDDLPEIIAEHGSPEAPLSEEILRSVGEPSVGLLIVETTGEKSSEIVTVPLLVHGARIEETPPTDRKQWGDCVEDLAFRVDEDEQRFLPNLWLGANDG